MLTFSTTLLQNRSKSSYLLRHGKVQDRFSSILIFGDSNTWGFDPKPSVNTAQASRIPWEKRWTTLVQQKIGCKHQIVVEALNARTTIFNDMCSPCDGEYDCNGRKFLTTLLHSHKPLKLVVLALGTNDLKAKFNTTPNDIVSGIRALVRDIQKATFISESGTDTSPLILILGPPIIYSTSISKMWGFVEVIYGKLHLAQFNTFPIIQFLRMIGM